jgi:hypothetical protein
MSLGFLWDVHGKSGLSNLFLADFGISFQLQLNFHLFPATIQSNTSLTLMDTFEGTTSITVVLDNNNIEPLTSEQLTSDIVQPEYHCNLCYVSEANNIPDENLPDAIIQCLLCKYGLCWGCAICYELWWINTSLFVSNAKLF